MSSNKLYHHGVVGMKWGVRRYQNKDGSLTEAGKKRYNDDSDKLAYAAATKYKSLLEFRSAKSNLETKLGKDPKSVTDHDKHEYIEKAYKVSQAYESVNYGIQYLKDKGYTKVDYDFLSEKDTGEQFVRTTLEDKLGNMYISELYLGVHAHD